MMWLLAFFLVGTVAGGIALDVYLDRKRREADRAYARQPNPDFRWCPFCGHRLERKDVAGRNRLSCSECGFVHWDNPKPVTITLVPMDGGLVLIRRKVNPGAGMWALPGGFIEGFEKPAEAAAREVLEETGLAVEIDRVLGAFGARPGVNQVIFLFLAKPASGTPLPGDDATEARVFKRGEIPDDIAFPLHREAIRRWFEAH
jgi:ADP-ribose pyrophosphatase YjhB (NUDIX family)